MKSLKILSRKLRRIGSESGEPRIMASGKVSDSENRATELDTGLPRYDVISAPDAMM